ncbi:MAG: metallophosphoesterase [Myxococcales bacterium]|nr:metallophosphoesterase [Myxococcales bacterium]MCB9737159.1 metallophosphoesterase [Deltaproteobacteria bacterium]
MNALRNLLLLLPLVAVAPAPGRAEPVTFGVIGDFGDDDDDTRAVAAMMHLWGLDLVVTVGDNDYSDGAHRGTDAGLEAGVGQYFADFVGDYHGAYGPGATENRFFPVPGDHDWGDTCDDPAGLDDYLAYFTLPTESSGNERYYDFRRGPVHFFMLDSVEDCEPDGTDVDSAQADWLRAAVAASSAPFKVVVSHHPPYSSGDHVGDGDHMRWGFAALGVSLVLSGHDHDYERLAKDGLTYVVAGFGGNGLRDFASPVPESVVRFGDQHGALLVTADDDLMTVVATTYEGVVVDAFTIAPDGTTTAITATPPPAAPVDLWPSGDDGGDGGGCAGGPVEGAPWLAVAGLIGLATTRRRRQRTIVT